MYDKPWESKALPTQPHPPTPEPTIEETTPIVNEATAIVDEIKPEIKPETTPTFYGGSLLSSISSTLQETSKYGSDSFLNSPEQKRPHPQSEVRFSSKGELEKIRAQHRGNFPSKGGAGNFSGPPRNAASLNALCDNDDTKVMYDVNTNSHIFRSLV